MTPAWIRKTGRAARSRLHRCAPPLTFFMPLLGLLLALCAANLPGCSKNPADPDDPTRTPPRPLTAAEEQLVSCDNTFAFTLFQELLDQESPGKNIAVSPLSVAMALTMALNGARGETQAALQQALALSDLEPQEINESYRGLIDLLAGLDPDAILEIANSIWPRQDYPIEADFLEVNRVYFDAQVNALDFSAPGAVDVINGWVETRTHGLISNILDNIPPDAVMYLINAIYFKAHWTYAFDPEDTETGVFHRADGRDVPCDMMYLPRLEVELPLYTDGEGNFQVLELPYGVGDFCMTLLLPAADRDLDSLIDGMTQEAWDGWLAALQPTAVDVLLPRFELEYKGTLNDVLTALGMGIAFTPLADFHGISPRDLMIYRVIHRAVVKVDETGTEAAAATVVEVGETSVPPSFVADRPFLFAIRDRHSGAILFMGKVEDPT
ncbi:MAG: serpin family protein [Candidatus Eisenbacteria bacterium]